MRYSFDLWNCLCKIMDAFVIAYIPFRLLLMRRAHANRSAVFFASLAILSVIAYGADFAFYPVPFQATLFLFVTIGLIYTCLIYTGPFYLKAILMGASISTAMLIRFAVGAVIAHWTGEVTIFSVEMTVSSTVLLALLTLFFLRVTVIPKTQLPALTGVSMAVFMIVMALATDAITELAGQSISFGVEMGIYAFSIATVLFLYFLFFRIVREYEEKNAFKMMLMQTEAIEQHLKESIEVHSELRLLRHELKNHVFYMQTMLSQKKLDDLEAYFRKVYRQEYDVDLIDSGSDAVNALLAQKAMFAKSKAIHMTVRTALPEPLPVDEARLCTVLSNLLDNAIEACAAAPDPSIALTVQQTGQYIHIQCRNTVTHDVLRDNPALKTTKRQENHGLGLKIVRSIVEELDGIIDYRVEDRVFEITLMLKVQGMQGVSAAPEYSGRLSVRN